LCAEILKVLRGFRSFPRKVLRDGPEQDPNDTDNCNEKLCAHLASGK
jgi:hypothetical protein